MQVWVGTSGYVYPDWVGEFYPRRMRSEQMLAYYATRFPLLELNFTFYRLPTTQDLARMAGRIPAGFQVIVKLHQSFSHEQDLSAAPSFKEAMQPLEGAGHFQGLLCQFPQRFHYHPKNRDWINQLADAFAPMPFAVEFRHHSWHREDVPEWLHQRGIHLVSVDVPAIPALYPSGLVQSSRLIYVRFHSRRAPAWYESDEERYDYLYSDDELKEWLEKLVAHRSLADRALLLFNNCRRAQAAINAERIQKLLESLGPDLEVVRPLAKPTEESRQGQLFS